ncbi:MAG: dihydrodipicolinate reductase [Deltaproteobacteria bacterium]|nr:dihydrodipicolinate reductase [Deltaproteobacteria bacterium]
MALRIVQWTTGNVGRRSVRAIAAHPDLELVGLYAWGPDKVGQDAGSLCGLEPLGVAATDDVDALIALAPDCISYNPLWPDLGQLCRFLESGINVATTAAFITGHGLGEPARTRIQAACQKGRASIFGSGMNPGFANLLALVSAGICDRVDRITVTESVDATGYASAETQQSVGFGHPITHPGLHEMVEQGTAVFSDGVHMMADALDIELSAVRCETAFAVATRDHDLGFMRIDEGCVAGVEASWHGLIEDRSVIQLKVQWKMGQHMEPDWPLEHGYVVHVEGQPEVHTKLQIRPPKGFQGKSFVDFMELGMIITAMPAINAIPHLCRAAPGIRGYGDLPLVTSAGLCSAGR